jgi:branched-chain amino acid transport system ATP-binding protein
MLSTRNVSKSFGGIAAVRDLSLIVENGQVTSLVGPNGAGKTTVLNILTGFVAPDSGGVFYEHEAIDRLSRWRISQLGVVRTFQELRLCRQMTAIDNVFLGFQQQTGERLRDLLFRFRRNSEESRENIKRALALLEQCGLVGLEDELVEQLSYGQQKLLSICCCLAADSRVLLLDEPVAGVQPETIQRMTTVLQEFVRDGKRGMLIVEHDLDFVARVSNTVIVMDQGAVVARGTPDEIAADAALVKAYLS